MGFEICNMRTFWGVRPYVETFMGLKDFADLGVGKKRNLFMQREKRLFRVYALDRWTFCV